MFTPHVRSLSTSASLDRLQKLIESRRSPGADKEAIDRRVWDLFGERWAVMFTDLSGFSRQVAHFGIIHFLQTISESLRLLSPVLDAHDGILLKVEADSMLVIFRRADSALDCALAMQRACRDYNQTILPEEQVLLCVGLGFGDVLRIGDEDVFGTEVNAASKLGEDRAKGGEILVTGGFRTGLSARKDVSFHELDAPPAGCTQAFRTLYRLE